MTVAVALILMITGFGPHENLMIPPALTAARTAAEVQLAAVPRPTTWRACDVSTERPAGGTGTERTPGAGRRGIERAGGAKQAPTATRNAIASDTRRGIPEA